MLGLVASILALGVGPLVYQTFGPMKRTDKFVSGFILAIISLTLFVEVLPDAFTAIGFGAIVLALIGFAGPTLVEKSFTRAASKTHILTLLLGILGIVLHATLDGAAIQINGEFAKHESLSLSIVLHRLPIGLTIWWLLRPLIGERYSLLTLVAMALATVLGYSMALYFSQFHSSFLFSAFQSFISGSLLHVIYHKPHSDGCMHTSAEHDLNHGHNEESSNTLDHSKNDHKHTHSSSPQETDENLSLTFRPFMPKRWTILGFVAGMVLFLLIQHPFATH